MRGKVGKGEWIRMSHLPLQLPHSAMSHGRSYPDKEKVPTIRATNFVEEELRFLAVGSSKRFLHTRYCGARLIKSFKVPQGLVHLTGKH